MEPRNALHPQPRNAVVMQQRRGEERRTEESYFYRELSELRECVPTRKQEAA